MCNLDLTGYPVFCARVLNPVTLGQDLLDTLRVSIPAPGHRGGREKRVGGWVLLLGLPGQNTVEFPLTGTQATGTLKLK